MSAGFPHSTRVVYVRNALAALRGRLSRPQIAGKLGVAEPTLSSYASEPGSKGAREIPMRRLTHLMCIAEDELKRAQGEMGDAVRQLRLQA